MTLPLLEDEGDCQSGVGDSRGPQRPSGGSRRAGGSLSSRFTLDGGWQGRGSLVLAPRGQSPPKPGRVRGLPGQQSVHLAKPLPEAKGNGPQSSPWQAERAESETLPGSREAGMFCPDPWAWCGCAAPSGRWGPPAGPPGPFPVHQLLPGEMHMLFPVGPVLGELADLCGSPPGWDAAPRCAAWGWEQVLRPPRASGTEAGN